MARFRFGSFRSVETVILGPTDVVEFLCGYFLGADRTGAAWDLDGNSGPPGPNSQPKFIVFVLICINAQDGPEQAGPDCTSETAQVREAQKNGGPGMGSV